MSNLDPGHIPVLPDAVVGLLDPQPGETFVDATLGRGGHAAKLIPRLAGGTYLGLDADPANAEFSRQRLAPIANAYGVTLRVVNANFASIAEDSDPVDGLLADLGFASNQVDDPNRGFSFMQDGPLDMRLNTSGGSSGESSGGGGAGELVNTLSERELADVIYRFGEERLSRRIARKIVEARGRSPINTTGQLATLCRAAYGPAAGRSRIHPATRTFQALRIAVNGELDALDALLAALPGVLAPGGRAAIISFHSLEDRPVKRRFLELQQTGVAERLTRKPITAAPEEAAANPRSRSAKLRGIRKYAQNDRGLP
ncbi:MAG: 16S rRNA (cytosine(1402)-N(4))-methyltransferase RsmH [Planctomycetota bacterium]